MLLALWKVTARRYGIHMEIFIIKGGKRGERGEGKREKQSGGIIYTYEVRNNDDVQET